MKVFVVKRKRRGFVLRWNDPLTGKLREQTAKSGTRNGAADEAATLQLQLERNDSGQIRWTEFRARYEREQFPTLRATSQQGYRATFRRFEKLVGDVAVEKISPSAISQFAGSLRSDHAEATVRKHLRHLKAVLRWAKDMELIERVPTFPRNGSSGLVRKMKGRPLTEAEFATFLAAIPKVVPADQVNVWEFLSRGLWYQALRVGESLDLWWDRDDRHRVDLKRRRPVIWIRGDLEKGKKDRMHPIAPEFAELLLQVPEGERTGRIFKLPGYERYQLANYRCAVSRIGSDIGRCAGILVGSDAKTGQEKYVSFHDLRRSCALRWSEHLNPQALMEFMRHSSLQVTMDYYVGQRAEEVADAMWQAYELKRRRAPSREVTHQ